MPIKRSKKLNRLNKKSQKNKQINSQKNKKNRSRKMQRGGYRDNKIDEIDIPIYQLIYNNGIFRLLTRKYQLVNTVKFLMPTDQTVYNSYFRNFFSDLIRIVSTTLINTNKFANVKHEYYRGRVVIIPKGNEVFGKDYLKTLQYFKENLKKALRVKYPHLYKGSVDPRLEIF